MNKSLRWSLHLLPFGVPLLVILLMAGLTHSFWFTQQPELLSLGITVDLVLTVPLVYLFLTRKQTIPRYTAVPFFVAGIIIGSFILPQEQQFYLTQVRTWVLPLVEAAVLLGVILKARQVSRHYRVVRKTTVDFYTALKEVTATTLPQPVAPLLASEIAVLYYGFFSWQKRSLLPHEFSYHRRSTSGPLLITLLFLILIETVVVHLLLARWSTLAAWILTGISCYTLLQIFGMLRSLSQRPIALENGILKLRYGILSESTIPLTDIDSVTRATQPVPLSDQTRSLSPLGDLEDHNVLLRVKSEGTLHQLYGFRKSFTTLPLYLDEPEQFASALQQALGEE